MMRVGPRVAISVWTLCLAVAWVATARGEGACGNGIVNHNEECDPGGRLHCNGDPRLPTCRTGADCASGVNCYFALSCCKFNCQYVGQGATCYDGNDCTGPDRCNHVGVCTGDPKSGNPCDDGNTCTSNDSCVRGTCTGTLPAECNDHNPCTDDFCDPVSGCGHTYNTAPCDDGQLCTGNDTCRDGVCTGSPEHAPSCDDGNPCTEDCCDPTANGGAGACVSTNNTAPCDDGRFCTGADRCSNGQCVSGPPFNCDDGNHCTVDLCDEQARSCRNIGDPSKAGQGCDDQNLCTSGDVCNLSGGCSGTPVICDDGNDCTDDTCRPLVGCLNIATEESRDCPGSCFDGINNDPLNDRDVDFEDSGCASLGPIARFGVVGTSDRNPRDLILGGNTTVGSTRANGTCDIGTNQCVCPSVACEPSVFCARDADCSIGTCNTASNSCECVVNCPVAGSSCQGDADCLFEVDGTCGGSGLCECPAFAPNCQPLNRPCSDDSGCRAAPYPMGASFGGVCGNGMLIVAGTHMGLLASATLTNPIRFGKGEAEGGQRTLDIEREFANAGGMVQFGVSPPFVGPLVCSDAPAQTCRVDSDCAAGTCTGRRVLGDGNPFESFDGQPGFGLAGTGSSENFKRCDVALSLLRSGSINAPSILQAAIEAYVPAPGESVSLGPGNCLHCPAIDSPDAACTPCAAGLVNVQTKANPRQNARKMIITVGGGLQIIDLRRFLMAGNTSVVFRGEDETELLIRVERALRSGSKSHILLEGMTSDQVLFVAKGRLGGGPLVSANSTWRGSIMATERRAGITLGAQTYIEGGIYGQRVLAKGPTTTVQHMPWRGKLPNVP